MIEMQSPAGACKLCCNISVQVRLQRCGTMQTDVLGRRKRRTTMKISLPFLHFSTEVQRGTLMRSLHTLHSGCLGEQVHSSATASAEALDMSPGQACEV